MYPIVRDIGAMCPSTATCGVEAIPSRTTPPTMVAGLTTIAMDGCGPIATVGGLHGSLQRAMVTTMSGRLWITTTAL